MKKIFSIISVILLTSGVASAKNIKEAYFAGGCFWCMEDAFEKIDGIEEVISGYSGGKLKNPTYKEVTYGNTGHFETAKIIYDEDSISFKNLLNQYWRNIVPFDSLGQFCDKGTSYLSAIFVSNQQERSIAENSKQRVVEQFPEKNVVTPVLEASTFYPIRGAESYHQDFYKKSPIRYKTYRWSCGRDKRLREIWGTQATH